MSLLHLILRNIRYHLKSWLITLAGTLIGTAVLTGALVTGDSVKYSLHEMVRMRLGNTTHALAPLDRYFRQSLAADLESVSGYRVAPLLQTTGTVASPDQNLQINRAFITGVTPDFFSLWQTGDTGMYRLHPGTNEAIVSLNTANRLNIKTGDFIVVKTGESHFVPSNAPFVSGQSYIRRIRLKVKAIAGPGEGGRFSLENNQSAPFNVFVPLDLLADKTGLQGFVSTLLIDASGKGADQASVDSLLQQAVTAADAGLIFSSPLPGLTQIESRRIFIEDSLATWISDAIPGVNSIFTYLANAITRGNLTTPYSFVTAAGSLPGNTGVKRDEIIINSWLAEDLQARPGDRITLHYYRMGQGRTLREEQSTFTVSSVIPVGSGEAPRALMPDFPGMKNSGSCRDWETGTPVDLTKIRDRDEAYWNDFGGTPKAWIRLDDGQALWKNAFGSVTAFRTPATGAEEKITREIRRHDPAAYGLRITPVLETGLEAASRSTDFGELFLGLGGLVVMAGLLLSGMMFSLFLKTRSDETSLLRALGINSRTIFILLVSESMIISLAGGLAGTLLATGYAHLIISGLNTLWQDAVHTSSLVPHIRSSTLLTGFLIAFVLNMLVFLFVTIRTRKRALPGYSRRSFSNRTSLVLDEFILIRRNLAFRKFRAVTASILLALGMFTVLITGLNRPGRENGTRNASGTGGFSLWISSTLPLPDDLIHTSGLADLLKKHGSSPQTFRFVPLPGIPGDDASCLNLNQVTNPALLGVPASYFDRRNAFSFIALGKGIDPEHPWTALETTDSNGIIQGFADQTVITWGIQKKIGDTLWYVDEQGREIGIRLAGGLANSLFQGYLLVSDSLLRSHFPTGARVRNLLAAVPDSTAEKIAAPLEYQFRDEGLEALPAREKLASFESVTNTYLDVFMVLGGLGMIIGTAGLAVIVLRHLRDRRDEMKLYSALGFNRKAIYRILSGEFFILLITGTGTGALAALMLVMIPGVPGNPGNIIFALLLTGTVLLTGWAWIHFPVRRATLKNSPKILSADNEDTH